MASKYAELSWPHDQGVEVVDVIDKDGVRYLKRLMYSAQKMEIYLANGYTFTPLVAMTSERVAALRLYVDTFGYAPSDWPELTDAYHTLREMLAEMEGAHDEA